jgi:hypothetical protein
MEKKMLDCQLLIIKKIFPFQKWNKQIMLQKEISTKVVIDYFGKFQNTFNTNYVIQIENCLHITTILKFQLP